MRVLCLTSSWPRERGDIAGCFVRCWADALVEHGAQVRVLCWGDTTPRPPQQLNPSLSVRWVRYSPRLASQTLFYGAGAPEALERSPARWALVPGAIGAMWAAALQEALSQRPTLIVGHWLAPSGLIARCLGELLGIPAVIITHSGGIHALKALPRPLGVALARFAARGPMSFVSQAMLDRFQTLAEPTQRTILPMGFEPPRSCIAPAQERSPTRWVMLGRLVPIKRPVQVIEAFLAAALGPDHILHVIGAGPELGRCLEAAAQHPNIIFEGALTGEAKDAALARCQVALFGSDILPNGRQEGLPVSLLECMSAGLVPLVAQIESAQELLIEPSAQRLTQLDAWPQVIRRLAHDEALRARLGALSAEKVKSLHWEELGPIWAKWLFELVL